MKSKPSDEDARWLASQIRPEGRRPPQPIAEVLSRLMARRGYAQVQVAEEWVAIWNQAAGDKSRHSRPGRCQRGVLEIVVENSVTLQELAFQKKQLLARIAQMAPPTRLRDLKFKVGDIR